MDRISRAVKDAPGRIASAVEAADIRGPVRTPPAATPDPGFFRSMPGTDTPDPGFSKPTPDTRDTRDPGFYRDDIVDAGMADELPARSPARPTPPPAPAPAASSGRLSPGLAATPTSKAPAPKAPTGTPTFDKVSKDQIFAIKAMIPPTNAANAQERTAKVLRILEASPEVIMEAFGYPRTAEGLANARTWLPTPGEPASVTEQKTGALLAAVSGLDSGPPVRATPAPAGPTSGRLSPGLGAPAPSKPVTSASVPRAKTAFNPAFDTKLEETKRLFEQATGHTIAVTSATRTPEEQAKFYAQGRTTPGPIVTPNDGTKKVSKHQIGEAADVQIRDKQGRPVRNNKQLWATFGDLAKQNGLTWGGDFKAKVEPWHVQLAPAPEPKPQPK
jgi:hypothetical protein